MKMIAITEKAHRILRRARMTSGIGMGKIASILIAAFEKTNGGVTELVLAINLQKKK